MSATITSVPLAIDVASRSAAGIAAQPGPPVSSITSSASRQVSDSFMFSEEAQRYLEAAELFSLMSPSRSLSVMQSAVSNQGGASEAQIVVSGAASGSLFTSTYNGETVSNAVVNGPATEDGVLDVAAFDSGANSHLTTQVNVGNGNDTVNATTNAMMNIDVGSGNDTVNVTSSGAAGMALVQLGSGNDVANLNGNGIVAGGSGTSVINLSAGCGFGGAGNTIINGNGAYNEAFGGTGTTTINNIPDVYLDALDTGSATVNLPNAPYSHVVVDADSGNATINLSDPAAGVSMATSSSLGQGTAEYCQNGKILPCGKADANGDFSGVGELGGFQDVLPTEGQPGYGLAHARIDFTGITADQVTSSLQGSTLTLTVTATGKTTTINDYQPGRVTFTFSNDDNSDFYTASRQPPNLTQADQSA